MQNYSKKTGGQDKEISYLKARIYSLEEKISQSDHTIIIQQKALDSSLSSTLITDEKGTIIWVNSAFTKLTGYTFEEAINQNPRILKSGKHDDIYYSDLWNTIKSGKVWKGEITNKKKRRNTLL